MGAEHSTITADELYAQENDRFHRFRLIHWWDQERLRKAKVLVVGAGAIGNEVIKNLALLGVGHLFVTDLDVIENSNLSRSVLFREEDCGCPKADVAAVYAKSIYPGMKTQAVQANVSYDLGLGVFLWADVVIGALDNREARLAINRACYKLGKPYLDGAIEQLDGVARTFIPDGPCYECTMSKRDWELLEMRRSCALLTRAQMLDGKVPTTPTMASMIAAVQVQEAVKYLHGMPVLAGKGFHFFGLVGESYLVEYSRKEDCYSHDPWESIESLDSRIDRTTAKEIVEAAKEALGPDTVVELNADILTYASCGKCGQTYSLFRSLGKVTEREGQCLECGQTMDLQTTSTLYGDEDFLDRSLSQLGLPRYEILTVRNGSERRHWLFAADAADVLGGLVGASPNE